MTRHTFMNSVYVFFTSKLVPDFEYRREVCFFSLLLALYSKFVSRKYGKRVKSSQWACNELKSFVTGCNFRPYLYTFSVLLIATLVQYRSQKYSRDRGQVKLPLHLGFL